VSRIVAPLPPDEPARLAAVRRYEILDTPPDRAFDRVAGLAARLLASPIATVSIVDAERIWFKARHGLDQRTQTPRAPGLGASAILRDGPHVVPDAAADPVARANPLVAAVGLRFYAGWPITTPDGYRLGTVDVIDTQPRQVGRDELAVLGDLAAMVAGELERRLSASRAVEAERALRAQTEREKALVEQIAALEAERTSQLEHALEHRVVVEQAKGVLMGREGLGVQEAFERLRAVARSQRRPVEELASGVVAGRPLPAAARSTRQRPRRASNPAHDRQPRLEPRTSPTAVAGEGELADELGDGLVRITRTFRPSGLCVEGELDQANIAALAAALTTAVETSEDVHLDLAELEFIDVGGLRLLADTARRLPAGRYLVLDGVAPYLRRILALVGWDQTPGLKIGGDQP
jgi:anti-anti-sigma factor